MPDRSLYELVSDALNLVYRVTENDWDYCASDHLTDVQGTLIEALDRIRKLETE